MVHADGLRLTVARSRFRIDPLVMRTAYNPEGAGMGAVEGRQDLVGLAWEAGRLVFRDAPVRWSVGANYRRWRHDGFGTKLVADTMDLGTTVAWAPRLEAGTLEVRASAAWLNVLDKRIPGAPWYATVPRPARLGARARLGLDWPGRAREAVGVVLAYTRTMWPHDADDPGDAFGSELLVGGVLAVRAGRDQATPWRTSSWGLGLVLDEPFLEPAQLALDWGKVEPDTASLETMETWSWRVGVRF